MIDRPLLINGFMATGKSSVARQVAERTHHPYVDLDERFVQRTGLSIPAFFEQRGEDEFRALERAELLAVVHDWRKEFSRPPVCALGGGALVHRPTRLKALRHAVVVSLDATPQTILERALCQGGRPLLDTPNPEQRIEALLEQRRASYREANAVLCSDQLSAQELGTLAAEVWERNSLAVAAADRSYAVEIGDGFLGRCLPSLLEDASGLLLVTDETVHGLYAEQVKSALAEHGLDFHCVVLPAGEAAKQLSSIECIYRAALQHQLDRRCKFFALGGGVVTDMTGFAAASWLRGVRWVGVASTLLAMVDASVGGKTGVDFGPAKNSVGAFWQPHGVICDTALIRTESERAYLGALAEVVKTALIGDVALFELLEQQTQAVRERDPVVLREIVHRSVALKAWVVATDERESGIRAWLNLGHTVGHALEAQGNYTRLTHGEAVSLGLMAALRIGQRLGQTPKAVVERTCTLLQRLGLPWDLRGQPLSEAAEFLAHDKKRSGGKIRFVLTDAVGQVSLHPLQLTEVQQLTRGLAGS